MSPRERFRELYAAYLSGGLDANGAKELRGLFEQESAIRQEMLTDLEIHGMLGQLASDENGEMFRRSLLERIVAEKDGTRFLRVVQSQLPIETKPPPGGTPPTLEDPKTFPEKTPPSTRRARLRTSRSSSRPLLWTVAAAAILLVATLILVLGPSDMDPSAAMRAKEARARASKEAEARRQAEQDRLERERALVEAQAKRLDAEAQLREIEEKRRVLTQRKPEPPGSTLEKEKREKDLEALKRDQERIEQELRQAAELAKRAERQAPAVTGQEEKAPTVPVTPPTPSQGTTLAALAEVEEVAGEAFVVMKAGKSLVTPGTKLLPGQGLLTGGGTSRIVLRFPDKTRVDLGPETSLAELKTDSGKRLVLTQGTVRAVVAKQPKDQPMLFVTPHGQAQVVGTTLRLTVDPDPKKKTSLEVEEGKVELKNLAGKAIFVESGHYAVAAVGVELVQRALPPRPRPAGFVLRGPQGGWGAICQTVSLVPNETYTLSVWIQTSAPSSEASCGPFPGGSLGIRTESGSILARQPFGQSEAYGRKFLSFKAGPNPVAVLFVGFANDTPFEKAFIHIDDWSLVQKAGDGSNLVQDPDYEGQNKLGSTLSGPWFTEGTSGRSGLMGLDPIHGRIPGKGSLEGERR